MGRNPKWRCSLLFLVMKQRVFNASLNYSIVYLPFITRISGSIFFVSFFPISLSLCLFVSYLVRFFSSVVDHSSENKMTANNLAICIGCSLLYPKDPCSTTTPLSNSYTNGSILFETFVTHHRQLFPLVSSTTNEEKSSRIRPDLIPTDFHPTRSEEKKSRSNSKENYLEVVTPLHSTVAQP